MPVVQYKQTAQPCQVEGLPLVIDTAEKTKDGDVITRAFDRSAEGALHFRPGGTMVLSADEFSWLKSNASKVFNNLLLLADDPAPEAKPEKPSEPSPKLAKKSDLPPPVSPSIS
jgi:hypothetical protein